MSSVAPEELGSLKVVKSNDLVRSSYRLSKRALVFIYYLIAKLDSVKQDEFTDFVLSYSQIVAILNFDGKRRISKRKEVFQLMDDLNHAPIFREDAEDAIKVNRLSSVTHHKKTDHFRLRLDPLLKPHLLFLRSHFTEFFYKYILPMELPASIGLYGLLKSYHAGTGMIKKIFTVEDLKFRL